MSVNSNLLEEAIELDLQKYGETGRFWKHSFGSPKEGQLIDIDGLAHIVTFSGDFTIDCTATDFSQVAERDNKKYGRSGGFWKVAYGSPDKNQVITDVDGTKLLVTFSGDYTISLANYVDLT